MVISSDQILRHVTPRQKLLALGPFSALQAGAVLEDPYKYVGPLFKLLWKNSRPIKRKSGKYSRELMCHPMRHIFAYLWGNHSEKFRKSMYFGGHLIHVSNAA